MTERLRTIHPGRKVFQPGFMCNHGAWLWWIEQNMTIRPVEFRKLRHANGRLWYAGGALAQKTESGKPGSRAVGAHILPKSDIDSVVILGHITIDIVQSPIADLDIHFTMEQSGYKLDKGGHDSRAGTSFEMGQ